MKKLFTISMFSIILTMMAVIAFSQSLQEPARGNHSPASENLIESSSSLLCVPEYVTGCALGDGFSDFAVEEIENYGSGCANLNGTGWSQYLELGPATLYQGQMHDFIMGSGFTGNFVSIWIDFDDDNTFSPEEMVLDNYWIQLQNQLYTVPVQIPADALTGTHYMRARTRFANFCDDPCASYFYGEAEDYMVTIEAAPSTAIFEDDFEAYNAGEQLACQNPDEWTTWSNLPCSLEDAYISDDFAYSGVNSVNIVTDNDQVKNFETYFTSGVYDVSLMIYVPSGADGYYNVMSDFDGAYEWGFEVYFNTGGDGSVNGGGTGAATFTFPFDTWMFSKLIVDLDNDMAYYFLDGEVIHYWQWTLGASGGGSQLQLAAVDFFGANATTSFYFDDFKIDEGIAPPPPLPPSNLVGPEIANVNQDIILTWDEPGLETELAWDNGINNDAIGLTNGGTFSVASHWTPAELAPYNGMSLDKITFFAGDYPGPSFTIKVWTGESGIEVLSQPLASFVQNDWNEIELETPYIIDASEDLWFGYETTHEVDEYPAGVDAGPAIITYGDMILNGGSWESMYVLTAGAIDANWNLIATLNASGENKEMVTIISKGKHATPSFSKGSFTSQGFGSGKKYNPSSAKDLLGYNVYRNGEQIAYTAETTYTDIISVPGFYSFFVTAVWDIGESIPTNTWNIEVGYFGINTIADQLLQIFPNPTDDFVKINSDLKINTIHLYDQIGQKILVQAVESDQTKLDLTGFHPGIYLICIDTEKGTITKRLILN
ncbi:MAG: T9SS type A sorting domain-containing protein [Bacteroidetes bacterium]|nr:T9SS type A sorting domain-containing protein [Bacteroidota bacterium]